MKSNGARFPKPLIHLINGNPDVSQFEELV
jgi:hypothetical protein